MHIKSKKSWLVLLIAGIFIASLTIVGCSSSNTISIAGSTTVQPLAEALRTEFNKDNPGVTIEISGGGSSVGVTSCNDSTVDIGAASRDLKASEPALVVHTIARDGIALVTHPSNGVDGLTKEQVRQIYLGNITNWNEVGGEDHAIIVIARDTASGTRAAFMEMVMDEGAGDLITGDAILKISNGDLRTSVSSTEWSIGFLSFGYLDDSVKGLEIDGVAPEVANAMDGSYSIVRPLNLLTKGEPTGLVKDFIDFCLSAKGQAVVAEDYIPVS